MQNKIFGTISIIFALILSIILPIIFEINGVLVFSDSHYVAEGVAPTFLTIDLIIYIISKVLVSIALIIVGVWIISGKSFVAFSILTLPLTLAIQALPLFNRLLAQISWINVEGIKTWAWSINMLVTIIVLFVYILLVFVLKINSDKTKAVEKFAKPKEIKVQQTTSYMDENGDLKGPGSR